MGGKVLPTWTSPPPAWLTYEHWAPLAIVNYGDRPFYVNAEHRCPPDRHMAIRTDVLKQIGRFQPELQRVQDWSGRWRITSCSSASGSRSADLGAPARRDFRSHGRPPREVSPALHLGHSRFGAMARLENGAVEDGPAVRRQPTVPAGGHRCVTLVRQSGAGRWNHAFLNETGLLFFAGFVLAGRNFETGPRGRLREVATFARRSHAPAAAGGSG